jgi:Ala-tRNA(Pro) deacylase
MAISMKLKNFLDANRVSYKVAAHHEVYTAQEIAASMHIPGKELAKVVMVKAGEKFIMMVLPASWRIEMAKLRSVLGIRDIRLATEEEFKRLFPDCEPGAMPPFGNLYGLEVYEDKALTDDEEIVFQGGNHIESIRMRRKDFERLVKPRVADFGVHIH